MEHKLPVPAEDDRQGIVIRSAIKGVTAGALSAAITNPMDVLRNEMFKRDTGLVDTCRNLQRCVPLCPATFPLTALLLQNEIPLLNTPAPPSRAEGFAWGARGMVKNMAGVAAPIAICIFLTDVLACWVSNKKLQQYK